MRATETLAGKYRIIQDTELYRFTSDAVHLARFERAKKGERVADFCAGSGVVGLHFYAENEGIRSVTLFEMDTALSAMSEGSVRLNGLEDVFSVVCTRLQDIGNAYAEAFTLVLCNPPYERGGFEKADPALRACRKELSLTLGELAVAAKKVLTFGGRLSLIHRADRVSEVLCTLHENGLEPKRLRFVAGKTGAKPYAVLVTAVKGGKAGVDVLPTLTAGEENA